MVYYREWNCILCGHFWSIPIDDPVICPVCKNFDGKKIHWIREYEITDNLEARIRGSLGEENLAKPGVSEHEMRHKYDRINDHGSGDRDERHLKHQAYDPSRAKDYAKEEIKNEMKQREIDIEILHEEERIRRLKEEKIREQAKNDEAYKRLWWGSKFTDMVKSSIRKNTQRRDERLREEEAEKLASSASGFFRDLGRMDNDARVRYLDESYGLRQKIETLQVAIANLKIELESKTTYAQNMDSYAKYAQMLKEAEDCCFKAHHIASNNELVDNYTTLLRDAHSLYKRAYILYSEVSKRMTGGVNIWNKHDEYMRNAEIHIGGLNKQLSNKKTELEELKNRLHVAKAGDTNGYVDDDLIKNLDEKIKKIENGEIKQLEAHLNSSENGWNILKKRRDDARINYAKVSSYVEDLINKGHSAKAAKFKAAQRYNLSVDEVEKACGEYSDLHEERVAKEGHKYRGIRIPVISGMKDWGRRRNASSVDELLKRREEKINRQEQLKSKLKYSAEGTKDYQKTEDELNEVNNEIAQIDNEINLFEEHPELINRATSKFGGWLRGKHQGINDAKDKLGSTMISKYSSFKEKASSGAQLILGILIFAALIWLTLNPNSKDFMPVNIYQVFIFIVLTLILGAIKFSLSDDTDGQAEARELVLILTIIFTIFAIAIHPTWSAIIFCLILGIYVFFLFFTNSLLFSIIIFIMMCFMVWLTMAGWADEMGIIAEKTAQQTGFYDAIMTTINSLNAGISDVSMMLINPTEWYAKKEMEKAAVKGEGHTNRALEISEAKVSPSVANYKDNVNVIIDAENFGKEGPDNPARNAKIILSKKDQKYADRIIIDGKADDEVPRSVGDILSGTDAQEVFEVQTTQDCLATFALNAKVKYDYSVDANTDVFIIKNERYTELMRQNKFEPVKQVTKSTSGPVSVSMRTNVNQPIPVPMPADRQLTFHFGVLNERSGGNGVVTITNAVFNIPPEFTVKVEEQTCKFIECTGPAKYAGKYTLKELHPNGVCDVIADLSKGLNVEELRYFTCNIVYDSDKLNDVYFSKPFNILAHVDYNYEYSKEVSFSLRNTDINTKIPKCS